LEEKIEFGLNLITNYKESNLSTEKEAYYIFKPQLDAVSSNLDQIVEIKNQLLEIESNI
jgi:hypothetical protein